MNATFRRVLSLCIAALSLLPICAQGFPPQLNGTMMPYNFSSTDSIVPWGDDMKPVFINYVARHGARYLSSEKKVESLCHTLHDADSTGTLSDKGRLFMHLLQRVDSVTDGNWGALNATGIYEEQRLGEEMTRIAPDLLAKGEATAVSSYVPRVVMTMYELCHQLARHSTHISVSTSEGRQFDSLLRYFTTDSAYVDYLENGDWKAGYDRFVNANISVAPARSLFTMDMPQGKLRKLTLDMYGVLQSLPAARLEWQPEIWFSLPEYRACWEAANLKHYYQRSVSEYSSVAAAASSALLDDIIRTNDAAAAGKTDGKVAALRFGHAETVIPLFALMRLPGCYYPEGSAESVASEWKDWEVSPLGANLMIVMLKDRVGDTFVSLRLNGRWLTMTSPDGNSYGKIIPWSALRKQWLQYIPTSH